MERIYTITATYSCYEDGVLLATETRQDPMVIDEPSWKNSVDTGSFVPGIYRVNPYSVCRTSVFYDYHSHVIEYEWLYQVNFWHKWLEKDVSENSADAPLCVIQKAKEAVPVGDFPQLEQIALQKAYAKIEKADLALGETLGEYKETIQMLREPLSSLRKFLLDDRSRNLLLLCALGKRDWGLAKKITKRMFKDANKGVPDTWLELRYGLRPLIKTVQEIVDYVEQKKAKVCGKRIRSCRSQLVFPKELDKFPNISAGIGYQTYTSTAVRERTQWASASVQYQSSFEPSTLDTLGLTPRFLPEVAWELTRLSFVVDWLLSIGPWLATLRVNPDVHVLGNTSGVRTRDTWSLEGTTATMAIRRLSPPQAIVTDCKLTEERYYRKVQTELEYHPHYTWGRTLDLYKLIDALSLTWQFATKLKR